jgi:hypothetical protein
VTAASDPDILAGVERWARVRGLWRGSEFDARKCSADGLHVVGPVPGDLSFYIMATNPPTAVQVHRTSPAIALAWALLVETDTGPVDVGRCPACVKRGGPMEWRQAFGEFEQTHAWDGYWAQEDAPWTTRTLFGSKPTHGDELYLRPRRYLLVGSRPCPTCSSTGRETKPAARLLLDAASEDATTHAALSVHADHLQAAGDPRGELLALALGPWYGEPTERISKTYTADSRDTALRSIPDADGRGPGWTVELRGPSGQGPARLSPPEWTAVVTSPERGHPGTAPALRWLEWLTWAREFAAELKAQARPWTRDEFMLVHLHVDERMAALAWQALVMVRAFGRWQLLAPPALNMGFDYPTATLAFGSPDHERLDVVAYIDPVAFTVTGIASHTAQTRAGPGRWAGPDGLAPHRRGG